jgi:hypothetical protein
MAKMGRPRKEKVEEPPMTEEQPKKEIKLHSYIKPSQKRSIAEGFDDGRWVGQMERLDYELIAREMQSGDPKRMGYRAIADLFGVSVEVVGHFVNLPAYKARTKNLNSLKAETWRDWALEEMEKEPETNPQAKKMELKMKFAQWMMEKCDPDSYGRKVEVTNVNVELSAEDRAKRLAEIERKLLSKGEQS